MKKYTVRSLLKFLLCLCLITSLGALAGTSLAKYVADIPLDELTITIDDNAHGYVVLIQESDAGQARKIFFGSLEDAEYSNKGFAWKDGKETGYAEDKPYVRSFTKSDYDNNGNKWTDLYYLTEKSGETIIINSNSSRDDDETNADLFPRENNTIISIDLSKVQINRNASNMFHQLYALKTVTFPANVSAGTNMTSMFFRCTAIESIDISNFDTQYVENMESMFAGCSSLTSINFGESFNTANVKEFHDMFRSCGALTELDLSKFDTGNANLFQHMFEGCRKLKTIYVGDAWKINSDMEGFKADKMFTSCISLVGGKGTVFDSSHVNAEYARVDGGADNPGYLTHINDKTKSLQTASYALAAPASSLPEGVRAGETVLCVGMPEAMDYIKGDAYLSAAADEKFIGWLVQMNSQSQQADLFRIESLLSEIFEVYPNAAVDLTPLYEKLS